MNCIVILYCCSEDTHVDELGLVAGPQVVEDGGLVEVGEVAHVLALLELGRVHLRPIRGETWVT